MAYYIFVENEKINGAGQARILNEETINFEVDESLYNAFVESPDMYIWDGNEVVVDQDYEAKQAQKERKRIALLNMTGADVERAIYKVKGIDFDDILAMVKDNPAIDEKALKIEFKANNFFRGNPYIEKVGSLLGFTEGMLNKFFETKDYHYLTKKTLTINATPSNAIITIDGEVTNKVEVPYGTDVEYSVELEGYTSYYGSINLIEDKAIDVELKEVKNEETNTTIDDSANE